jgi:hypothetical protein
MPAAPLAVCRVCACSTLRVTYPSTETALIAYNSVVVDEEIRPDRIYRHCRLEENVLVWSLNTKQHVARTFSR